MTTKILDAINLLLVERWPNAAVYRDAVPKDFERPSFLIELIRESREAANPHLVRVEAFFTVTAFEPLDEYGRMATPELIETQREVMALFAVSKLQVDDRSFNISVSSGGTNQGEAYVDIQCEYITAAKSGGSEFPAMGNPEIKIKLEGQHYGTSQY